MEKDTELPDVWPENEEGYNAYLWDISKDDNPYPPQSKEYYRWAQGWDAAQVDRTHHLNGL